MKNSDESHKITETVYKNLAENFNPGVRQIIACGKLYHKAARPDCCCKGLHRSPDEGGAVSKNHVLRGH